MSKKIEQLTPEQEALMHVTAQEWIDNFFKCQSDDSRIIEGTRWLYKYCNLEQPDIFITDSPMACQVVGNLLKGLTSAHEWMETKQFKQLKSQVEKQLQIAGSTAKVDDVMTAITANKRKNFTEDILLVMRDTFNANDVPTQLNIFNESVIKGVNVTVLNSSADLLYVRLMRAWAGIDDEMVRSAVIKAILIEMYGRIGKEIDYFESSNYGNPSDYGWVAFYDYMTKIGVEIDATVLENFTEFMGYIRANPFYSLQLEKICIISRMPDSIKRDVRNRLHCEDGPAIHFRDGYELFYWKGTAIKRHWIMNPDQITDKELKEGNAELRRILIDILGVSNYFSRIGSKLTLIDEDMDNQGFPMKLMKFKFEGEDVQVLECVCPSTERVYNLYPPNQSSRNVWDAKASICNVTVDTVKAMTIET